MHREVDDSRIEIEIGKNEIKKGSSNNINSKIENGYHTYGMGDQD